MTRKQILLSAFIIGSMSNIVLATEKETNQPLTTNKFPNLLFAYTITKKDYGCTQNDDINVRVMQMDAEMLEMFKKVGKEKDFITCPLSIPNLSQHVNLYNHQSQYINEFNACELLQTIFSSLPQEELKSFILSKK